MNKYLNFKLYNKRNFPKSNININEYTPFKLKEKYNSIIPLKIYQTWHTKEIPPIMTMCITELKTINNEFEHFIYDENECIEFIKQNFPEDVIYAYNKLVPYAFKSDLWRYCILYKYGGIYVDVKFRCVNGFKMIALTEQEYFVKDCDNIGIYNALIAVMPKNEIMLKCINKIVENVKNNFYGYKDLCITGPHLLCNYFTDDAKNKLDLCLNLNNTMHVIKYSNIDILASYIKYREEQQLNKKFISYGDLWKQRKIYL